jgi:hypothetical protein
MRLWWAFGVAVPVVVIAACASKSGSFDNNGGSGSSDDDGGGSGFNSGSSGTVASSGTGRFTPTGDGGHITVPLQGACKAGEYTGTFGGLYTSHLTGIGFPIPVVGNVDLTLNQEGSSTQTCKPEGEIPVPCDQVFTLKDGVIQGTADGLFPYYCSMTGTLNCADKTLVNGWIQCTYCVGPLADGGMACSLLNGVGGTTGVGGQFAGPLTADYDVDTLAFVNGTWNGAEALAGNDGTMPGPDGGPVGNYLTPDGGLYLGPNDFGGVGTWNATFGADH